MGRTIPTFTRYLENELASWSAFRRALVQEDREAFDQLFRLAKRHIAAASCATRPIPFDALVMAILLEQQKEIERLKSGGTALQPARHTLRLIPIFTKGLP
jgi:hypothetical protein